jgi:hypothetical protein
VWPKIPPKDSDDYRLLEAFGTFFVTIKNSLFFLFLFLFLSFFLFHSFTLSLSLSLSLFFSHITRSFVDEISEASHFLTDYFFVAGPHRHHFYDVFTDPQMLSAKIIHFETRTLFGHFYNAIYYSDFSLYQTLLWKVLTDQKK